MAEDEYSLDYISEVMGKSYGRVADNLLNTGKAASTKTRKEHRNELLTPEDSSAAVELTDQADTVRKASSVLTDATGAQGAYDSYSKYSAVTQQGMTKKMQALGMLDDAREDVDIQMHVAEFVDPITGEKVNAKNMDYVSDKAYQGIIDKRVNESARNLDWEADYADYEIERAETQRIAKEGNGLGGKGFWGGEFWNPNQQASKKIMEKHWTDNEAMGWAWKKGKIETDRVITDMNKIYQTTSTAAQQQIRDTAANERDVRRQQALGSTEAYNSQQAASQDIANTNNAQIVDAQDDIKRSLNQDKQNLASQTSDGSTKEPQTVLKDVVASGRPT